LNGLFSFYNPGGQMEGCAKSTGKMRIEAHFPLQ
jgi:hypothetical protein